MSQEDFKRGMMNDLKMDTRSATREAVKLYGDIKRKKWEIIEYALLLLRARGDYGYEGFYHQDALTVGLSEEEFVEIIEGLDMYTIMLRTILEELREEEAIYVANA